MTQIDALLDSFGLRNQADTLIGTPIRKGISGGQKRRVSVASQLITGPKILFLDEPTSGLDSAASLEVMSFIKEVARRNNVPFLTSLKGRHIANLVLAHCHSKHPSTFNVHVQSLRQTPSLIRRKASLLWNRPRCRTTFRHDRFPTTSAHKCC